jgi:hypothetical protein
MGDRMRIYSRGTALSRALRHVRGEGECWRWMGASAGKNPPNGRIRDTDGRLAPAHRVIYEAVNGPVPPGLELARSCPNAWCVHPAHLRPTTHRDLTTRAIARRARQ